MPKPKRLSGQEVVSIFVSLGFEPISQRGSHVKLQRVLAEGSKQTLTVPAHGELEKGTSVAIYKQALRYIAEGQLRPHFYTD
jgi:predicted RNA binding protein YcfA (HicA-like mRNA interferase family)